MYLVVIYAPIVYKSITFKAYIKDVISFPDRYTPATMRALILAEAEKYGFVVDYLNINIDVKKGLASVKEARAQVRWHTQVRHIIRSLDHRMNFSIDTKVEFFD